MDARSAIALEEITRAEMAPEARGEAWLAANEVIHSFGEGSTEKFRNTVRCAIQRRHIDHLRREGAYTRSGKARAVVSDRLDRLASKYGVQSEPPAVCATDILRSLPPIFQAVVMYQAKHGSLRGLHRALGREAIASGLAKSKTRAGLIVPSASNLERMLADVRRCAQGQMAWHELRTHSQQPQRRQRRSVR